MGGHGHANFDALHPPNTNAPAENDAELKYKIRPIDLVKHNPQLFYMYAYDP